ncbi:synaptotagmin-5-like [Meleagris gallopavo]|uniref:synaptotagmin-5-like n=1 Tax=Meleagris gallopavo TaxID=9103 RepID=UPI00093B64B7|nr:synaptotagmin-5-like [Meleagris gallopavo]
MVFRYQSPQTPSPSLSILSLSGTIEGGAWIIHLLLNRCFLKFAEVLHESLPTVVSNTDVTPIAHSYAAGSMMGSYWSAHECEECPCSSLSVKIIRMRNLRKADLFSQADCYVSLSLPTASSDTVRTRTIKNCRDPVWNEIFCFRIQSQVKHCETLKDKISAATGKTWSNKAYNL